MTAAGPKTRWAKKADGAQVARRTVNGDLAQRAHAGLEHDEEQHAADPDDGAQDVQELGDGEEREHGGSSSLGGSDASGTADVS